MRLFLAVNPPDEIKKSIARQLEPLKKEYPNFKWVDEKNYHITLQFFGDKDPKRLGEQISESVFDVDPFYLYASGADLFMRNTITMHLTFYRSKEMEGIVERVREKFQIHESLKYVPHLTFARYRVPAKQQYLLIKKKIGRLKIDLEFKVAQITLYNSVIESEKSFYETISEIPLTES